MKPYKTMPDFGQLMKGCSSCGLVTPAQNLPVIEWMPLCLGALRIVTSCPILILGSYPGLDGFFAIWVSEQENVGSHCVGSSGSIAYTLWWTNILPWKDPPFFMGKSTISMAIFHCFLLVHQRVVDACWWKIHALICENPRCSPLQRWWNRHWLTEVKAAGGKVLDFEGQLKVGVGGQLNQLIGYCR